MSKFKLKRIIQCAKCPWKVSTNPFDIPYGYCEIKHQNLKETIAKADIVFNKRLKIMACHHSKDLGENVEMCVGYLENQLGTGNNIGLRIKMLNCENISEIKTIGEQHKKFEETLPK
jgi:hypothetical protein